MWVFLYVVLLFGLGVFIGFCYGVVFGWVSVWMSEIELDIDVEVLIVDWFSCGEQLLGFGYKIYQNKDLCVEWLLKIFCESELNYLFVQKLFDIINVGRDFFGLFLNVDFVFVVIERIYGFLKDSGKMIFCVGCMVGWIVYVLE